MPRKFSLDIPRLKIGTSKTDRALREHLALALDSPPPSPKSTRPPLPSNIEAELRLACAQLVAGSAPEGVVSQGRQSRREKRAQSISQLQHSIARPKPVEGRPPVPQLTKISTQDGYAQQRQAVSAHADASGNTPWSPESIGQENPRKTAVRVDQVMAGQQTAHMPANKAWLKPTSHQRSKSTGQAHLSVNPPKSSARPNYAPRADSIDTTHSAIHSDMTDDRVTTSTGMTSAVITPALASRRTSEQALANAPTSIPRFEQVQTDDMRETLDKHRKLQEQHDYEESVPVETLFNDAPQEEPKKYKRYVDLATVRANTSRFDGTYPPELSRPETRSQSRSQMRSRAGPETDAETTQEERTGRSTFRERASRAARSLSRGLRVVTRSASRHRETDHPMSQRLDSAVNNVKEFFRPETPRDRSKTSFDIMRRARLTSRDSLLIDDLGQPDPRVLKSSMPNKWDPYPRHTADDGRPGSVDNNVTAAQRSQASSPAVDLNRKLPPLPSLESWQAEITADDPRSIAREEEESRIGVSTSNSDDLTPVQQSNRSLDFSRADSSHDESRESQITTSSVAPEMSATVFPGDFDFHAPLRTPSPCSESSIREFMHRPRSTKPSILSMAPSLPDDDIDMTVSSPTSPKVARMISSLPITNVRPHIIQASAARRPSESPRPPPLPRKDSIQAIDAPRPSTSHATTMTEAQQQQINSDLTIEGLMHAAHPRHEAFYAIGEPQQVESMESMIEASSSKPLVLLRKKTKKSWLFGGGRGKKNDWMADVEQSGSKSGMLLMNESAMAPVIKY